jgi:hypothetical protein
VNNRYATAGRSHFSAFLDQVKAMGPFQPGMKGWYRDNFLIFFFHFMPFSLTESLKMHL